MKWTIKMQAGLESRLCILYKERFSCYFLAKEIIIPSITAKTKKTSNQYAILTFGFSTISASIKAIFCNSALLQVYDSAHVHAVTHDRVPVVICSIWFILDCAQTTPFHISFPIFDATVIGQYSIFHKYTHQSSSSEVPQVNTLAIAFSHVIFGSTVHITAPLASYVAKPHRTGGVGSIAPEPSASGTHAPDPYIDPEPVIPQPSNATHHAGILDTQSSEFPSYDHSQIFVHIEHAFFSSSVPCHSLIPLNVGTYWNIRLPIERLVFLRANVATPHEAVIGVSGIIYCFHTISHPISPAYPNPIFSTQYSWKIFQGIGAPFLSDCTSVCAKSDIVSLIYPVAVPGYFMLQEL